MGTTNVESNTGATSLTITNSDGSFTSVSIGVDGQVSRVTTRTDPSTGLETSVFRAPDGRETRAIVGPDSRIEIVTEADGSSTRTETVFESPDENTTIIRFTSEAGVETTTTTEAPDGTVLITTEHPDGSVDTRSNRTFTDSDGSSVQEVSDSDGSFLRSVSRADGSNTTSQVAPDGTVNTIDTVKHPDGRTTVVSAVDGEVRATIEEVPVPGGTRTTSVLADGSPPRVVTATVRESVDEQGRTVTESVIDGPGLESRVSVSIGTGGEGSSFATDADGLVVEQRRTTFEADGTRVDEVTEASGITFVARATPLPEGGHQTTVEFADGSTVVHLIDPVGRVVTNSTSRDGVETITDLAPDGSGSRITTQPDGGLEVDTFDADPVPNRGVVFDDDDPPVLGVDASDAVDSPAANEVDVDAPVLSVPRDVLDVDVTDRIRETTDTDDVDHADFDAGQAQPTRHQPATRIEVEIGQARFEEEPPQFEVVIGEARVEPDDVDPNVVAGEAELVGHPGFRPSLDPNARSKGDFTGFSGAGEGTVDEAGRPVSAGGVVVGGGAANEVDVDAPVLSVPRDVLDVDFTDRIRETTDTDEGSTNLFAGAGETAQAIVDDLTGAAPDVAISDPPVEDVMTTDPPVEDVMATDELDDPLGGGYVDDIEIPTIDMPVPTEDAPVYVEAIDVAPDQAPNEAPVVVDAVVEPVAAAVEETFDTVETFIDDGFDASTSYVDEPVAESVGDAVEDFFSE